MVQRLKQLTANHSFKSAIFIFALENRTMSYEELKQQVKQVLGIDL